MHGHFHVHFLSGDYDVYLLYRSLFLYLLTSRYVQSVIFCSLWVYLFTEVFALIFQGTATYESTSTTNGTKRARKKKVKDKFSVLKYHAGTHLISLSRYNPQLYSVHHIFLPLDSLKGCSN